MGGGGRLGLLGGQCPHPARDGVDSLRSCYARVGLTCNLSEGPARGGRAGLAGVTAQGLRPFSLGAPRRGTCEATPIRHGTAVTPSSPGKGGFAPFRACARAGLPYGRPASPRLVRSALRVRGGDLLRRPTEVTPAPPAMGRVWRGAAHPYWMYRKRRTRIHSQADHNSKRGTRGQRPPGPARPRRASPFARRDPCKRGAPVARRAFAQSARHSHARTV